MTYFNTTNESGQGLLGFTAKAASQEDKVRAWFQVNPLKKASPFKIQGEVLPGAPITSVRRAMTNLTAEGFLVRLDEKVLGPYGRPCYVWGLRSVWVTR